VLFARCDWDGVICLVVVFPVFPVVLSVINFTPRRNFMALRYARLCLEQLESRELLTGNVILDWNAAALDAIRAAGTGPPPASRALAMLHVAMYDAVDVIEPQAALYPVPGLPGAAPPHGSAEVAAAAAADRVLDQLFPEQAAGFDSQLRTFLAN
jgi:hypothetical protein